GEQQAPAALRCDCRIICNGIIRIEEKSRKVLRAKSARSKVPIVCRAFHLSLYTRHPEPNYGSICRVAGMQTHARSWLPGLRRSSAIDGATSAKIAFTDR